MEKQAIGFFGYLLRLINWIFIIAILASYLAQWISPEMVWPLAFFGIAYPIFLIVNVIFLIHWIFRRRRFLIYPLIALVIGMPMIGRFFQIGSNTEIVGDSYQFKILSYNVHVLDYYKNNSGEKGFIRDQILDKMVLEDADIYCFQEFYPKEKKGTDNIKYFKEKLDTKYSYSAKYIPHTSNISNVILSKFPIINKGKVRDGSKGESIGAVFVDLQINDTKVRVYSVHLESIKISGEKDVLKKITSIETEEGQEVAKKQSIHMIKKFKNAFALRAKQIALLKEHIDNSPFPVFIVGDFNDTPSSYAYSQLRADLDDAFIEKGSGLGQTYIGPYPSFRIDNIFYDPQFTCTGYNTIKIKLSDHYPISAKFSIY